MAAGLNVERKVFPAMLPWRSRDRNSCTLLPPQRLSCYVGVQGLTCAARVPQTVTFPQMPRARSTSATVGPAMAG